MDTSLYILSLILCLLGVFSFTSDETKIAAIVILFAEVLSLSFSGTVVGLYALGSLAGGFFLAILSMIISFIMLTFYAVGKQTILLKLATACAVFTSIHMLYIMTYIKPIREMWWYHSPTFDLFYWNYGELQIVLTLYMISLFWKSGIAGLSNGFNAVFGLNKARNHIHSLHNLYGAVVSNGNSHCKEVVQENKSYKKGITRC